MNTCPACGNTYDPSGVHNCAAWAGRRVFMEYLLNITDAQADLYEADVFTAERPRPAQGG